MKISKLIDLLNKAKTDHGDIDAILLEDGTGVDVCDISIAEDSSGKAVDLMICSEETILAFSDSSDD